MEFHKKLTKQATNVLDPINVDTTWTAGITAAAGTGLAQSLFFNLFTVEKSSIRWNTLVYSITLSSIVKFPRLLHPVELGIVSQIPS